MLPTLLLPLVLGFSSLGTRLAAQLPLSWLVGFHGFRLALELVMHEAAREGTMPAQMTFTGDNFDIVTGASALVVALLIARGRATPALVLAWNALGTLLLAVIVVVAIASLPPFHAYGAEPAHLNTWVAYFPFVWLPAALVSAALFGHVILWRRLLTAPSMSSPAKAREPCDQGVLERASHR
jgi:small-conductance mechanosensitive channel